MLRRLPGGRFMFLGYCVGAAPERVGGKSPGTFHEVFQRATGVLPARNAECP
jgi:hypothetical protein